MGGVGFCPGERVEPGVTFLFTTGLDLGDDVGVTFVELVFLVASGLANGRDDFADMDLLEVDGEAIFLFSARGLVVAFFIDALLLPVIGLTLGLVLPTAELDFFTGEGESVPLLVLAADCFLLLSNGEEEPLVFLPVAVVAVVNLKLELPFLPATGLPLGDKPLEDDLLVVELFVLVFCSGETNLLDDVLEVTAVSGQLRTLSIIPITLNSSEVWDGPLFSGGVKNLSDDVS